MESAAGAADATTARLPRRARSASCPGARASTSYRRRSSDRGAQTQQQQQHREQQRGASAHVKLEAGSEDASPPLSQPPPQQQPQQQLPQQPPAPRPPRPSVKAPALRWDARRRHELEALQARRDAVARQCAAHLVRNRQLRERMALLGSVDAFLRARVQAVQGGGGDGDDDEADHQGGVNNNADDGSGALQPQPQQQRRTRPADPPTPASSPPPLAPPCKPEMGAAASALLLPPSASADAAAAVADAAAAAAEATKGDCACLLGLVWRGPGGPPRRAEAEAITVQAFAGIVRRVAEHGSLVLRMLGEDDPDARDGRDDDLTAELQQPDAAAAAEASPSPPPLEQQQQRWHGSPAAAAAPAPTTLRLSCRPSLLRPWGAITHQEAERRLGADVEQLVRADFALSLFFPDRIWSVKTMDLETLRPIWHPRGGGDSPPLSSAPPPVAASASEGAEACSGSGGGSGGGSGMAAGGGGDDASSPAALALLHAAAENAERFLRRPARPMLRHLPPHRRAATLSAVGVALPRLNARLGELRVQRLAANARLDAALRGGDLPSALAALAAIEATNRAFTDAQWAFGHGAGAAQGVLDLARVFASTWPLYPSAAVLSEALVRMTNRGATGAAAGVAAGAAAAAAAAPAPKQEASPPQAACAPAAGAFDMTNVEIAVAALPQTSPA
jgi:hypothetical protein